MWDFLTLTQHVPGERAHATPGFEPQQNGRELIHVSVGRPSGMLHHVPVNGAQEFLSRNERARGKKEGKLEAGLGEGGSRECCFVSGERSAFSY